MRLEYELIDEGNINLATSIQHTIFPDECAYVHYKYAIDTNYKNNKYFIIKWNAIPVGVIGLYMDAKIDNESIWLGWFGILPEFRSKGIGRKSILDMIEKAKEYNKKYFRLYTNDNGDSTARPLYRSVMQLYENYNNPNDYNYGGNCLIYSYSLCDEKVSLWNNKFLNLKEDIQDEKQGNNLWNDKYKILILSNQSNNESIEDIYLATSFREDGHIVKIAWVDYYENLDDRFDIIIRRNTWFENKEETNLYKKMKDRLKEKDIKIVNDKLILLEIEDNGPHMNLERLDIALRKNVLNEYKRNIYQFLNK